MFHPNFGYIALPFEPETSESQSKAQKIWILTLEFPLKT